MYKIDNRDGLRVGQALWSETNTLDSILLFAPVAEFHVTGHAPRSEVLLRAVLVEFALRGFGNLLDGFLDDRPKLVIIVRRRVLDLLPDGVLKSGDCLGVGGSIGPMNLIKEKPFVAGHAGHRLCQLRRAFKYHIRGVRGGGDDPSVVDHRDGRLRDPGPRAAGPKRGEERRDT